MAYIGNQIRQYSDRVVLDSLTASATANYTLQLNGSNYVPSSAESLTVSLNGIIQKPQNSYTVSGSTLSFASALTASDSIDFVIAERGITLQTPSAGSVNTEQLANNAVTSAKLSAGKVLQVVQATHATEVVNSTATYAATGLTASITPISTSNKILILVNQPYKVEHTGGTIAAGSIRLVRDSVTVLLGGDQRYELYSGTTASDATLLGRQDLTYLDSPSTTSSVTYTTQLARYLAGDVITTSFSSTVATITLMEVSG